MITVTICTHNPRPEFLERVMAGLRAQTLSSNQYEILLIDNASERSPDIANLAWHPNARLLHEPELGLTRARLRGMREARGELIVFVDDDNILFPDYLEEVVRLATNWPMLGTWGGQVFPDFEEEPSEWLTPYLPMLAIRSFERDSWSNISRSAPYPCGAGLCARRTVFQEYVAQVTKSPLRAALGRQGSALFSCEDTDIVLTGCDMGLGTGRFTRLKLTHLIPKERLTEEYVTRLVEADQFSWEVLKAIRGEWNLPRRKSFLSRLASTLEQWSQHRYERSLEPRLRRLCDAERAGRERAAEFILKHGLSSLDP